MKRTFVVLAAASAFAAPAVAAAQSSNPVLEAAPFIDRANLDWGKAIVSGDVALIRSHTTVQEVHQP